MGHLEHRSPTGTAMPQRRPVQQGQQDLPVPHRADYCLEVEVVVVVEIQADLEIQVVLGELVGCMAAEGAVVVVARMEPLLERVEQAQTG